ncbi:MAG: PSD1 domain-containing protein [Bryobacterales bacterium]|nr:PSD1 domain-containing protein [Bryobacterales bacterium]
MLWTACLLVAASEDAARQVLASRCWACHAETRMGHLRLDSRAAMLAGGKSGPALVPGDADRSRLLLAVTRADGSVKAMPPGAPLPAAEVETLREWVKAGAPWKDTVSHWAFQPLPPVNPSDTIDSLVTAALREKNLSPNTAADRRTLVRRVYFDLVGLPPEANEPALQDSRPDWLAQLVDRLLASPHFGEKWGRHWLDVARYGEDDFGGTAVIPYANAWRYRDWVVQAINRNLPYDRFLMAQIAGDLMNDESLVAGTGLLGGGPWYYGIAQPAQTRADERHDRVDVVTRGMLGVTVACARCHDHKYDPFTAKDYYALAGVFASTAYKEYPLVPKADADAWNARKKEVDEAEKALNKYLDEQATVQAERYAREIAKYMLAALNPKPSSKLNAKVLARWKEYLAKPEDNHPFLKDWFARKDKASARAFQSLIARISVEKKAVDAENARIVEEAKKNAPQVARTIVLPGGYRSEEDFNPGAYIPSKSLERDRYVAWNRTFGDKTAPLKFSRELTPELLTGAEKARYEELKARHEALKKALPPQYPYLMGAGEFEPQDLNLNLRGNPEALGDIVKRRFPTVLSGGREVPFDQGSGRLQLAETVAHHPLAARVAVNRVWLALFGQGLVRTPSNFGRVGDRPALPQLLEHLSARFVGGGYSLKGLVREIVLSETYQRSAGGNARNETSDPDNRYLWRHNRRRLDAEPLRDAMLAASGELDRKVGGESKPLAADFHRRTLYARTGRFVQEETLSLFDLPAAAVTCEQRVVTNVPLQKLFFLNSDLVWDRAGALAKRIEQPDAAQGVAKAYQLLFQRDPKPPERDLAVRFLNQAGQDGWRQYAQVLLSSNEFAYVD